MTALDLTGLKVGSMLVVKISHRDPVRGVIWECLCACGTVFNRRSGDIRKTVSCGCVREAFLRSYSARTHGMTKTPEWSVLQGMKRRCYNKNCKDYAHYGGRGITVCERWKNSFEAFFEDVGKRPTAKHTIDRWPNNDGNYEPGNVRWANRRQQANNTRSNLLVSNEDGDTRTAKQWADDLGIPPTRIYNRITRNGTVPSVLSEEKIRYKSSARLLEYRGETRSLSEWAVVLKVLPETLAHRIARGYPPEKIFSPEYYAPRNAIGWSKKSAVQPGPEKTL